MTKAKSFFNQGHEAELWQRLRRMRMIPLALLLLMALIFVFTISYNHASWQSWQAWLHAFAEAAMVGAMADWFAVTALFRHPLGLPIPHTAIVPKRKDEIGRSLAQFVADHFLVEAALRPKLLAWQPSQRLLRWLQHDASRRQLADYTLRLLAWILQAVDEDVPRRFVLRLLDEQLNEEQIGRFVGQALDILMKDHRHQDMLTMALQVGAEQLRRHRFDIRLHVRSGSPWWMPGFVDDRIVAQMLDRVEALLLAMAENPEHELRVHYHQRLHEWVDALKLGEQGGWIQMLRRDFVTHPVVQTYIGSLWKEIIRIVQDASRNQDSHWQQQVRDFLRAFQQQLQKDRAMQGILDQWINNALVVVISANRLDIVSLISDTIASWDARSTAELIELQIGADLQYIRINGTIVGGLIGLILFCVSQIVVN